MGATIVMTMDGPECSECGADLSDGLEILVGAERYTGGQIDEEGNVFVSVDPCAEGHFEWEILESACPECGQQIGGTRRIS